MCSSLQGWREASTSDLYAVRRRQGGDLLPHLEYGVDRRLDLAGHIADHVDDVFQVLAVQRLFLVSLSWPAPVGRAVRCPWGRERRSTRDRPRNFAAGNGQPQVDGDRLLFPGKVQQPDILATQGNSSVRATSSTAMPDRAAFSRSTAKVTLLLVVLPVPVHVNHPGGPGQDRLDPGGDTGTAGVIRAVDLGHQCREHRRTGRDLGHLDPGPVLVGNRLQQGADTLGNGVGLVFALVPRSRRNRTSSRPRSPTSRPPKPSRRKAAARLTLVERQPTPEEQRAARLRAAGKLQSRCIGQDASELHAGRQRQDRRGGQCGGQQACRRCQGGCCG